MQTAIQKSADKEGTTVNECLGVCRTGDGDGDGDGDGNGNREGEGEDDVDHENVEYQTTANFYGRLLGRWPGG